MVETRFMSDQREDPVGHRFHSVDFEQVLDELRGPGTVEDEYWERIRALQRRVGRGTFDRCVGLLNGPDGLDRCIGADVLSQLGYRDDKPWADESIPHLLSRLEDSTDEDALVGIAGASSTFATETTKTIVEWPCRVSENSAATRTPTFVNRLFPRCMRR
jgi:hypothetical protein